MVKSTSTSIRWAVLGAGLLGGAAALAAQPPLGDWALLARNIEAVHSEALAAEKAACEDRDRALTAWLALTKARSPKPDAVQAAAERHRKAVTACAQARLKAAEARDLWEELNAHVGQPCKAVSADACPQARLAARLFGAMPAPAPTPTPAPTPAPAAAPPPPAADTTGATTTALTTLVCPPATPGTSPKPPGDDEIQKLLLEASEAQAKVNKQRAALTGVYALGDEAASMGLRDGAAAAASPTLGGHVGRQLALDAAERGLRALEAAKDSNTTSMQRLSNEFVRAALQLGRWWLAQPQCTHEILSAYKAASEAKTAFEAALKTAETKAETAQGLRWKQEVAKLAAADQPRALRKLQLLDDNADAKALVGDDALFLSASTTSNQGTVRFSLQRTGVGWLDRANLQFSAPLSNSTAVLLERSADRLSKRPAVRFNWSGVVVPESGFLIASYGLTLGASRETNRYIDSADLSKLASVTTKPRTLGLTATVIASDEAAHALTLDRQLTWEAQKTATTCPVPPAGETATSVNCLTGASGAPVRTLGTVSSYEYRRYTTLFGKRAGVTLGIAYDAAAHHTDVTVPIYFIDNADNKKGKLNAGLRLGWGNKGRGSNVGIFVTTPFSLASERR